MLYCAEKSFFRAALSFGVASTFRSNGVMLAGFIAWGMAVEPLLSGFLSRGRIKQTVDWTRLTLCIPLSLLPALPFAAEQFAGYNTFCVNSEPRPWCSQGVPLIYSFIQSEYWNVGLFRYWTIQQFPNILLAAPVLILLFSCSVRDIRQASALVTHVRTRNRKDVSASLSIIPHAIHAFALALTLLVGAHTQIALRFAAALPYTYWSAASLFVDKSPIFTSQEMVKSGNQTLDGMVAKCWVAWSVVWGVISLIAWATFLPPA